MDSGCCCYFNMQSFLVVAFVAVQNVLGYTSELKKSSRSLRLSSKCWFSCRCPEALKFCIELTWMPPPALPLVAPLPSEPPPTLKKSRHLVSLELLPPGMLLNNCPRRPRFGPWLLSVGSSVGSPVGLSVAPSVAPSVALSAGFDSLAAFRLFRGCVFSCAVRRPSWLPVTQSFTLSHTILALPCAFCALLCFLTQHSSFYIYNFIFPNLNTTMMYVVLHSLFWLRLCCILMPYLCAPLAVLLCVCIFIYMCLNDVGFCDRFVSICFNGVNSSLFYHAPNFFFLLIEIVVWNFNQATIHIVCI